MFDSARFLIFLSAAILLAIAPGPGMLYVLARALGGGRREGLLSALGTFFGGMTHVFAAAAGISIILAKSAMAFSTVKYLGASYREILDTSDWDQSVAVNTPGQSGQPGSPHYSDLMPLWDAGRYFPLLYSRKAVEAETTERLVLEP